MTVPTVAKICFYGAGGLATMVAFQGGMIPGVPFWVILFFLIATLGAVAVSGTPLGFLPRLFLVLYVAPFTICIAYLWNPDNVWIVNPQGVGAVFQTDPRVIEVLLAFGTAGLFGLLLGFELPKLVISGTLPAPSRGRHGGSLPLLLTIPVAFLATWLSWLGAPSKTLLEAEYGQEGTTPRSFDIAFAGAVLVSYGLLVMLAIDAERDPPRSLRRRVKVSTLFGATVFIVSYLQLFRGDRDSIGLLAGLTGIFLTSGAARSYAKIAFRRVAFLAVPAVLVFFLFVAIGAARFMSISDPDQRNPLRILEQGLESNTWTAVLITNLGAAAEYRYGTIKYFRGETYLDYFLSLPPGFIASMIGYERPVDLSRGPNWWYTGLSSGGMHAAVVPFKNFSVYGPFGVMLIAGCFISLLELRNCDDRYWSRLTFAMMATVSFLWFWYGDMNLIRAMMVVVIAGILDRLGLLLFRIRLRRQSTPLQGSLQAVAAIPSNG